MKSTEIEIEGMKELLKENEIEIGRIKRENKNQKDEIKRLKGALDYANRDREDMHNKIIELGNKRESQRNMNYKLRKENKRLKEVYEACNLDSINKAFKISNLEMENKKQKDEIKRLNDLIEAN